jgi:hypothetical protein
LHGFRGCMAAHCPHARVPTLRRARYRARLKARYRLGAHPWSGGVSHPPDDERSFMESSHLQSSSTRSPGRNVVSASRELPLPTDVNIAVLRIVDNES